MASIAQSVFAGMSQRLGDSRTTDSLRRQSVGLRCPVCGADLGQLAYDSLGPGHASVDCLQCSFSLVQQQGIWVALANHRLEHFQRFICDYEKVRTAEGRGSQSSDFYLALPDRDLTNRNSGQWAIRSKTYRYIERKLLPAIHSGTPQSLMVLDIGAGNGWLSYRLARLGHHPVAVDLQTNAFDGLGAAEHFRRALPSLFPRFQAEMNCLPFDNEQHDCAIFNASFHYSEDYERTLAEAIRCLRPGGTIIIADSPTYSCDASGRRMLAERRKLFQARHGFASDSLASREYLTDDCLLSLQQTHHLKWTAHHAWYGLGWACRPLIARVRRRREPSQFLIYTAQVKKV
jgi:ubiquinone/menaquinone biosynthesis C-methylase UbiE